MKGILFTKILFDKTVSGQKTMTRRAGKQLEFINRSPNDWTVYEVNDDGTVWMENNEGMYLAKPRYGIGDIAFLKEPYHVDELGIVRYGFNFPHGSVPDMKFKNKMFMPERYARHYIRITDVRAERLYDITDEDCVKEGVFRANTGKYKDYCYKKKNLDEVGLLDSILEHSLSAKESFLSLFRFANNIPKSKEIKNIWCFAYSYVLCDKKGNKL